MLKQVVHSCFLLSLDIDIFQYLTSPVSAKIISYWGSFELMLFKFVTVQPYGHVTIKFSHVSLNLYQCFEINISIVYNWMLIACFWDCVWDLLNTHHLNYMSLFPPYVISPCITNVSTFYHLRFMSHLLKPDLPPKCPSPRMKLMITALIAPKCGYGKVRATNIWA
jgi:hypothetical protein